MITVNTITYTIEDREKRTYKTELRSTYHLGASFRDYATVPRAVGWGTFPKGGGTIPKGGGNVPKVRGTVPKEEGFGVAGGCQGLLGRLYHHWDGSLRPVGDHNLQ